MRPTLFHLGPIPIRSFGVMVLLGFLLALWYAMASARRRAAGHKPGEPGLITPDHIFDFALMALFVTIAGARTLYVLLQPWEFQGRWGDVFKIWTGGISVHGAIVSGILFLWWYCYRHKLPFLAFADIAAPSFALGYAIGRVGCFLNGCCYGHPCDLPWAVSFVKDGQGSAWTPPSHPTQLYATGMNLLWFFLLNRWSHRPHRDGEIFLGYLALYCLYRFLDEQFRKGATADIFVAGMTHAQVFSLLALPVILFFFRRLRRAPAPPLAPTEALT